MTDALALGHTVFTTIHAVAATLALVSGVVVVHTGRGFALHHVGVLVMALALGPSMAFGWSSFTTLAKVIFVSLAGLALFMVVQSFRAGRVRLREALALSGPAAASRWVGPKFVGVIGFNLISLTVAGTIVPVLRVGGGTVGIIVAVAVTVALGHFLVERRRSQVAAALQVREPVSSAPTPSR